MLAGVADGVADEVGQGPRKLVPIALHRKPIGLVGHVQDEVDMPTPGLLASLTHDVVG